LPAELVAVATLLVLAALAAPLTADWRRRLATRRFDAVYERNLLRRAGRGSGAVRAPRRPGPGPRPGRPGRRWPAG
jgi:hypothetical protein